MHTPSSIFRKEHPKDGCEKNTRKTATKRTHERRLRKEYPKEKPTFSQSCSWRNIIISESQRSLTKEPHKGASQRSLAKEPRKRASQKSPTKEPHKGASQRSLAKEPHKGASQRSLAKEPHTRASRLEAQRTLKSQSYILVNTISPC